MRLLPLLVLLCSCYPSGPSPEFLKQQADRDARMQIEDRVRRRSMAITSAEWHRTMSEYDAQSDDGLTQEQLARKNALLLDWRISKRLREVRAQAEREITAEDAKMNPTLRSQ